jgi:hypothetical protein
VDRAPQVDGLCRSLVPQKDYRAYLKNDICEPLDDLPLAALSRGDIAKWTQGYLRMGASGKTIASKHGF